MYFVLIIILLVLIFCLGSCVLKSNAGKIKHYFSVIGISILLVLTLILVSNHYKANPLALFLILAIAAFLMVFFYFRRI